MTNTICISVLQALYYNENHEHGLEALVQDDILCAFIIHTSCGQTKSLYLLVRDHNLVGVKSLRNELKGTGGVAPSSLTF